VCGLFNCSLDLISSSVFLCQSSLTVPCLIPPFISHSSLPPSCSLSPSPLLPPSTPVYPFFTLPPPPAMYRIVTLIGRRHKGKAQRKSVVRRGTSASQPNGESEKKTDVKATGPCHVDLASGHVGPLNSSTSRSNEEDVSTCNDDAITGRYLLRLAPPYNRQSSFPGPYHSNRGASDANFSLPDFSGQHQSHLTTY
jgi:hypothetical protein